MFTIYNSEIQRLPIKVWLNHMDQLDASCYQQAIALSNLPFATQWVVLLPDTHTGFGMPIGGVLATHNTIIPNAVGVDIGCGMIFVQTNIPSAILSNKQGSKDAIAQSIVDKILKHVPTGFQHHKNSQSSQAVDDFILELSRLPYRSINQDLLAKLDHAKYQIGTLGGGNHFIELQVNENGLMGIMIHSGSRHVGYKICNYFNQAFKEINQRENSNVPIAWDLANLPADSVMGKQYIRWMTFAMAFAKENRLKMMDTVCQIVYDLTRSRSSFYDIVFDDKIDCHHNYASYEKHFDQMVWVHRKGAINVQKDEIGIIPGAMGSFSYLVKGKGNPESFYSCSHGAGRLYSRRHAKKQFNVQHTIKDLKDQGVFLGKVKTSDIGEESRFAYKDIDEVINKQLDLITPISKLKTLAVVKG